MSSMAFDVATLVRCLNEIEEAGVGVGAVWCPRGNPDAQTAQQRLLAWKRRMGATVTYLPNLEAKASRSHAELNDYLASRGYEQRLEPFDGFGAVSLFDLLVDWLVPGKAVDVQGYNYVSNQGFEYPAFQLPPEGVEVYRVPGWHRPLLRLRTTSEDSLWLSVAQRPASGLDLADIALNLANADRTADERFDGAQVPMLDLLDKPDLSWLLGMETDGNNAGGYHYISQAFQQVHIRANQKGARGKAMSAMAATRGIPVGPQRVVIDEPFVGYFTLKGFDEWPLAMFYADRESWKAPANLD